MVSSKFLWFSLLVSTVTLLPVPTRAAMNSLHSSAEVTPADSQVIAQRRRTSSSPFKPRKSQPKPKYTVGGGRRSREVCLQDEAALSKTSPKPLNQMLTPLLPRNPSPPDLQLTLAERPTLTVYVPQTSAKAFEFTLYAQEGEAERVIYQANQALPQTPAIVQFTLPKDAPVLEIGKNYVWVVTLACNTAHPEPRDLSAVVHPDPSDPSVGELIRRIEPDSALANQLKRVTGLDLARLYGESGIWYDMVSTLVALRHHEHKDTTATNLWDDLLQSNGLAELKDAPLATPPSQTGGN